jgi:hypothetical protein
MHKLRSFFKVNSNYQLFMVNLVFAVTGTTALYSADIILANISFIENSSSKVFYWSMRILLVLPIYQVLLILIATVFGEFKYFWNIEKKMLRRFGFNFK